MVSLTYSDLQILATNHQVVVCECYLITDRYDEGIIVHGATFNSVTRSAVLLALNPDYQGVGFYDPALALGAQLGLWNASLSPAAQDVCIWDELHWVNITGANGSSGPSSDPINWTLLPKSRRHGYVRNADDGIYDFENDIVVSRRDVYGNVVVGQVEGFQWGNVNVTRCEINSDTIVMKNQKGVVTGLVADTSAVLMEEFSGTLDNVTVSGGSTLNLVQAECFISKCHIASGSGVDLTAAGACTVSGLHLESASGFNAPFSYATAFYRDITIREGAQVNCAFNAGDVSKVNASAGCDLRPMMSAGVIVSGITVSLPVMITLPLFVSVFNKTCSPGYSNFERTENVTALTSITLDDYTGIYHLSSTNPTETIATLTTPPDRFPVRFYPMPGLTATFAHGISAGQPRCNGGVSSPVNGANGGWIEFATTGGESFEQNRGSY